MPDPFKHHDFSDDVMRLDYWKAKTNKGLFSGRSAELRNIDMALERYHASPTDINKAAIRLTIKVWIEKEGREGRQVDRRHPRNQDGVVDTLMRQVTATQGPTPAELGRGWDVQYDLQHETLDIFLNQKLEWRKWYLPSLPRLGNQKFGTLSAVGSGALAAYSLGSHANSNGSGGGLLNATASAATTASGHLQQARSIANNIVSAVPEGIRDEVLAASECAIKDFIPSLVASITPIVGIVWAGKGAIWGSIKLWQAQTALNASRMHVERSINFGVPRDALATISRIILRERNAAIDSLSVSIGELGAKLAGTLADGGTATNAIAGAVASLLNLLRILHLIARDVQEKNAANDLMRRALSVTAFQACPILGAYYVCCASDAALANEILQRAGSRQDNQAELNYNLQQHIKPLQEAARRLIREHRFVIPALERLPGVLGPKDDQAGLRALQSHLTRQNATLDLNAGLRMPSLVRQNASANLGGLLPRQQRPALVRQDATVNLNRR
jgi:hypothetical protein